MQVFAIVEFAEEKSAERVLHAREPLLINGRRLTVKPRNIKVRGRSGERHHGDDTEPGDQEQHAARNHRGRKFKGHPNRSVGDEPQFKFDPEVQRQLASVDSVSTVCVCVCVLNAVRYLYANSKIASNNNSMCYSRNIIRLLVAKIVLIIACALQRCQVEVSLPS